MSRLLTLPALALLAASPMSAQAPPAFSTPQQLVHAMVEQERAAAARHEHYEYIAVERSDRTGGHAWTERVAETSVGRVRMLLAVDGKPLDPSAAQLERERLKAILADPKDFEDAEAARMAEESKSRMMLDDLDKGFLMDHVELKDGLWHVDFRPNPGFSPSGIEERVLHAMVGSLTIDAKDLRLVHLDARLPNDVSIGFGLLATIKAGSHFESDREFVDGHWRTVHLVTDIRGKAILFKSVARDMEMTRSDFHDLNQNLTLAQAVALVEEQ